jgi:hypothetical protein
MWGIVMLFFLVVYTWELRTESCEFGLSYIFCHPCFCALPSFSYVHFPILLALFACVSKSCPPFLQILVGLLHYKITISNSQNIDIKVTGHEIALPTSSSELKQQYSCRKQTKQKDASMKPEAYLLHLTNLGWHTGHSEMSQFVSHPTSLLYPVVAEETRGRCLAPAIGMQFT